MAVLKLPQLPERTPVKITISLEPELHQELFEYAAAYEEAYGKREPVSELIPFMIAGFLRADRAFSQRRKQKAVGK